MKTPLGRPSHYLAALFASATALFLAGCESIPTAGNQASSSSKTGASKTTSYSRNVDPVEISGFDTDDLKKAFRSVYLSLDKLSDEHFGPNSGNYQRIRRSVPVKVMMFGPHNFTPYEFEEAVLTAAQLQQIRDTKGSLWTRYTPTSPGLRTAKTDLNLMFMSHITLDKSTSAESGDTIEPRFLYEWKIMKTGGDGQSIAQGKEPLRARTPAALRLKPAKG